MPTYVLLVSFTDKGRKNFKQEYTATRDQFKKAVEQAGGKLMGYVTAGPYDAVEILDMPNEDAALSILLGSLSIDAVKIMSSEGLPRGPSKESLNERTLEPSRSSKRNLHHCPDSASPVSSFSAPLPYALAFPIVLC